jgi:ubiquitin carboxyl-terminal hydrolase 16
MKSMPDTKPLQVIGYAATASLGLAALVYFFTPNYIIDGIGSSTTTRKMGVVGLLNPGNDCFVNSVLQALAGLGDLRLYLIRELHRRKLEGPEIYAVVPHQGKDGKPLSDKEKKKLLSLQRGEVTQGLKDMIDRLNEKPIHRKTISAAYFIRILEVAFNTRISRAQQDAQELLQVVAERLADEYNAGKEARKRVRELQIPIQPGNGLQAQGLGLALKESPATPSGSDTALSATDTHAKVIADTIIAEETGFPLEGRTEAQIECQHCHFIPKAEPVAFVMLTLPVPPKNSTTLNECIDAYLKPEYIDDYKCDKCRLGHAVSLFSKDLARATSEKEKARIQEKIQKIRRAVEEDPEKPPEDVELPDTKLAPTRRIARHVKITDFPKVLVIHLQRSMYDPGSGSQKSGGKVSFPERLPLGGLLDRRKYKLLAMITHTGTHNSGHYIAYKRQHVYEPYLTPVMGSSNGPYSAVPTPNLSHVPTPLASPVVSPRASIQPDDPNVDRRRILESLDIVSSSTATTSPTNSTSPKSTPSTRPSSGSVVDTITLNTETPSVSVTLSGNSNELTTQTSKDSEKLTAEASHLAKTTSIVTSLSEKARSRRRKKDKDRWWRISDDRVRETKTPDVLGLQKEVYMLFYEMEREEIIPPKI